MMKRWMVRVTLAAVSTLFTAFASADLYIEVGANRSNESVGAIVEERVRDYGRRLARLSEPIRLAKRDTTTFSVPLRVILTQNGIPLPVQRGGGPEGIGDTITPVFEASGPRAFPTNYRTLLENVYTSSKTAIDAVFGFPYQTGNVKVLNYDADIQARYAVAGGYYVPNAPGGPEIRFPVYQSDVSASINYIHCLMLAYMGSAVYPFDAFNEGIVRAATMTVARTPGAIPNTPTLAEIEATLDSLYDVSSFYDWYNQPGIGSYNFIAPNLLNTPLPIGGSTGGIFLLRYQMAGSAWAKPLAEYPGFIAAYNAAYFANPNAYQTIADLVALGQNITNTQAGGPAGTVEGKSFADWFVRQHVLDTRINGGLKLVVQPIPIEAVGGSSDFGVFGVILNAFRTDAVGNETLLSGRSFPIYWRPDFTRFFMSAQDDVIDLAGAFGSVVPNFPSETFSGATYRVAVDVPFAGKIERVYLPAGGYSTGASPTTKNFYGTLVGEPLASGNTYTVTIEWPGGTVANTPINNFAFGILINDPNYLRAQPVTIRVFRGATEIITRRVNKGNGGLAVDLRTPECDTEYTWAKVNRLTTLGMPVEPFRPNPSDTLLIPEFATLVARYNSPTGRYDTYPVEGEIRQGLGYFVRGDAVANVVIKGRTSANTPIAVALQPGWNLISLPAQTAVTTANVQVTTSTEAVVSWNEAVGTIVGGTFFRFEGDPVNLDLGTLLPAVEFAPGHAYFVRCLDSDGGVLLFYPNGPRSPDNMSFGPERVGKTTPIYRNPKGGKGKGGVIPTNPTIPTQPTVPTTPTVPTYPTNPGKPNPGPTKPFVPLPPIPALEPWTNRLEVRSNVGHYTEVMLGQKVGATRDFSQFEDDGLPPSPGGFQAIVVNAGPLYRDMRPVAKGETYLVDLVGMIPGKTYTVKLAVVKGVQAMQVTDGRGRPVLLQPNKSLTFVANSSSMRLYLTVPN